MTSSQTASKVAKRVLRHYAVGRDDGVFCFWDFVLLWLWSFLGLGGGRVEERKVWGIAHPSIGKAGPKYLGFS